MSPTRPALLESEPPLPPTPIEAKRMRSLADLDLASSAAAVPATQNPAEAAALAWRKRRRFKRLLMPGTPWKVRSVRGRRGGCGRHGASVGGAWGGSKDRKNTRL